MSATSAALVAGCCVLLVMRGTDESAGRLGVPSEGLGSHQAAARRVRRPALAVGGLLLMLTALFGGGWVVVLAAMAGVGALAAHRVVGLSRSRRRRRERQRWVVELCDALSAELRGGLPTVTVVERACIVRAELAPVVAAARLGGDVADAFRGCGALPGAEGLRAVAAAWEVAGSSGAALATVIDRVAGSMRSDEDARAEVQAALGPPRATAKMLAVLPLFGIALGTSVGAHPVRFLLGTTWGLGCLAAGGSLALAGVWWVERLAAAAEQ